MADFISVSVVGDRLVAQKFDDALPTMRDRLRGSIVTSAKRMKALIASRAPGRLSAKVEEDDWETPDKIVGRVGFSGDWALAGALEYGGSGKPFKVSAHKMRLDHAWGHQMKHPTEVIVGLYRRTLTQQSMPARRFVRDPFEANKEQIAQDLQIAANEAVDEINA